MFVAGFHELKNSVLADLVVGAFQRVQGAAPDDGNVVAGVLVVRQQLAQFHLH